MIYDAHCHLDLMENMLGIIREIRNTKIGILAVGTTPKAYVTEVKFCKDVPAIHVGLGMHPQLLSSGYDDMAMFESLVGFTRYIGEVGLDFSKDYITTKEMQIVTFEKIIKLCEQYRNKVVSIHSLMSAGAVVDILKKYMLTNSNTYIFHWFTGSSSQLKKAIELGCYFSINPRMLKTKSGVNVIKTVPVNRFLLETDAPFTIKTSHIGVIEDTLKSLVNDISTIVGYDVADAIEINAQTVFRN